MALGKEEHTDGKRICLQYRGKEVGTIDLNDAVFGVEVNEHLVHMAVVSQLANKRQGTQKAKTRSEVSGGGRKPWRQKGTGHARQGSTRAPQWTGGGVVFAPTPRDYSFKLNKKERRAALKSALTSRVEETALKNKIAKEAVMGFEWNTGIILGAPVLVVLASVPGKSGYEKDGAYSTSKKDKWEMFDAGIAAQTFQLAAHECGIGSVVMGIFR